jgi:1,4-dihydroxy-6-naphthoate synthase
MNPASARKTESPRPKAQELKLAHSPDSDDAFMFYGLATRKIRTGSLSFTHILEDIESLNQKASRATYEVTAVSFHAYAYLAHRYLLLPCGASFGDRYGPIVVAQKDFGKKGLKGRRVAIPGQMTSAALALRLYEPEVETIVFPFDRIFDSVQNGSADAGVVIHEGQLTYARRGFRKVVDLGEWWHQEENLPLPLGGNAISRQVEAKTRAQVARLLKESIEYGLDHREEALEYAMQFSHGLDSQSADRFVSMYVNEWTLDYGPRGRKAVQTFLDRGFEKGIIPHRVQAEFVDV